MSGTVTYRHNWSELTLLQLWDSAKAAMHSRNTALATPLIACIETHRGVFLDDFTYARVSALTKTDLDNAWAAVRDAVAPNPTTRLATFT